MSLAEKAANPPDTFKGSRCSVEKVYSSLGNDEKRALRQMFDDPRWTAPAIYRALIEEGYEVSKVTVERHRRGDCRCAKESSVN